MKSLLNVNQVLRIQGHLDFSPSAVYSTSSVCFLGDVTTIYQDRPIVYVDLYF